MTHPRMIGDEEIHLRLSGKAPNVVVRSQSPTIYDGLADDRLKATFPGGVQMSIYAAQGGLQSDYAFQQRVNSCIVQETGAWAEPPLVPVAQILSEIIAAVAAAPSFASKFLWGDQAAGVAPGQLAITDSDILAVVQPMLEEYRPPAP
jgi:hypothetical protein